MSSTIRHVMQSTEVAQRSISSWLISVLIICPKRQLLQWRKSNSLVTLFINANKCGQRAKMNPCFCSHNLMQWKPYLTETIWSLCLSPWQNNRNWNSVQTAWLSPPLSLSLSLRGKSFSFSLVLSKSAKERERERERLFASFSLSLSALSSQWGERLGSGRNWKFLKNLLWRRELQHRCLQSHINCCYDGYMYIFLHLKKKRWKKRQCLCHHEVWSSTRASIIWQPTAVMKKEEEEEEGWSEKARCDFLPLLLLFLLSGGGGGGGGAGATGFFNSFCSSAVCLIQVRSMCE